MSKCIILLLSFIFICSITVYSQNPSWHTLPNAPIADTNAGRYEDMYFVDSQTGYIVSYTGKVYKTTNGGNNWINLFNNLNQALRSTGFFDGNTGIIGTLDSNNVLFRTTNGGTNFTEISTNIQGTIPKGICGISIVNSTTAFACGRYDSPANLIKTTNAGLNWISIPVDTSLARSLVDCHFWSADSGFVVGGYSSINQYYTGNSVILKTTNGGLNWTRVYQSTRTNEWCWKIQFVNRQLGFSSIERFGTPTFILKTINGGLNWQEISLPNNIVNLEGIGFVNEQTGWVGGWGFTYNEPTYETTNGGANWHLAGWGINMNRVRFISDTLAYAVGKTVYKYTREPIGIQQISTEIPKSFVLYQNYPNPFNPNTKIKFEIPKSSFVTIKVYDALGREITTLADENVNAGIYSLNWDADEFPSGIYFYKITTEKFSESKKMILLK